MPPLPLSGPSYSLLTPLTLRAFSPCPETGTIFGPLTAPDATHPEQVSRLICDGAPAEDLELCALLLGTEAADLASRSRRRHQRPPYPIPTEAGKPVSEKETRWFLNDDDTPRKLSFESPNPKRLVSLNFADAARSIYEFRMESESVDLSQSIAVGTHAYDVATDAFTFRIQAESFRNAAALAWQLSSTVYRCGQYKPGELGDLLFRRLQDRGWSRVTPNDRGKFTTPTLFPAGGVPFSLVSRTMAGGSPEQKPRPVFNIDLIPADESRWNVSVVLRRPHLRSRRLMPLHPKLVRSLWDPSFQKILKRPAP